MKSLPRVPVAVVLTSFDRGGTERQMTELIGRIDPDRFEVHAVCFRREGPWLQRVETAAASVSEFRLRSFRSPSTLTRALAFARWCRTQRIAAVHACDLYANIFALPAAALARVPLRIGSRRGIVSPTGEEGLLRLQALAYRCAHRIIANSAAAAAAVAQDGIPLDRISVIPNGIDLRAFPRATHRHPRRIITTVANLRGGKGHDVLLQAAAEVLRAHPDALFQLVGDGPLRGELEHAAEELGIAQAVRFLGHRDDIVSILRQSDLFAFPSLMEAFPNALMEAMAVGLPVVATNVGGIPELVEDGRNGVLVPPGAAPAFAAAITDLLGNAARADRLAIAARSTVEDRYSFERMTREFEAAYTGELSSTLPIGAPPQPWANVFPRV